MKKQSADASSPVRLSQCLLHVGAAEISCVWVLFFVDADSSSDQHADSQRLEHVRATEISWHVEDGCFPDFFILTIVYQ